MKIVSAPVAGGAYIKGGTKNALIHAVILNARGDIEKVLCDRVSPDSILDDETLYNKFTVTCSQCLKKLPR